MPFYEYQCSACGHHHEELQKINARPLRKCPACGRATLRRLVSAPVFRLKGGGWYETDFKADKEGKRNIAGDKDSPADKPKEDKTEAKPAETMSTAETPAKPAAEDKKSKPAVAKPASTRARRRRRTARR